MNKFNVVPYQTYPQQYNLLRMNIPHKVELLCRKYDLVICGGALTSIFSGKPINDFDLYPTRNNVTKVDTELKALSSSSLITSNAVSYCIEGVKIQLIKKDLGVDYVPEPEITSLTMEDDFKENSSDRTNIYYMLELLKQFDFTICMAGYDFKSGNFVLYEKFLLDLSTRKLVFNSNTKYPISSNFRVLKYIKKGYTLPAGESVKLALSINNLTMTTYKDLKDQLMGIDILVFEKLTNELIIKHGKDATIDYGIIMDTIEKSLSEIWEVNSESTEDNDIFNENYF